MCGISGLLDLDGSPADAALVQRMTGILAHRGPDGEGIHADRGVALGHRRLAILDLSTGAQPMASADGHVWITFNGEIYNYPDLRTQLAARGHRFRTRSDTEVLVHAYEDLDMARVHEAATNGPADLRAFLAAARDVLPADDPTS